MMRGGVVWLGAAICLVGWPALALQLELPRNARQTAARDSTLGQVVMPVSPYSSDTFETRIIEGEVTRRAYKINSPDLTPLQILAPLRAQIEAAGYEVVLDCDQGTCGGYDFRFGIEVLPAPNMSVNLRDYHFITGFDETQGAGITLLASSTGGAAYLQIIRARSSGVDSSRILQPAKGIQTRGITDLQPVEAFQTGLLNNGYAVLHDIDFSVGSTSLGDKPSADLTALAGLLAERPNLRVAVVGHTDTIGDLEANIQISRARALAVRARLVNDLGVDEGQITAEGMGYLAPRATNLTEQGREINRRVEVIVIGETE